MNEIHTITDYIVIDVCEEMSEGDEEAQVIFNNKMNKLFEIKEDVTLSPKESKE